MVVKIQNPYVFGDYFKYSVCSQKGVTTCLDKNSLVLFGTTTAKGFLLDTVFIVDNSETAMSVKENNGSNYSRTYKEETLETLNHIYFDNQSPSKNRIYKSKTWWESERKDFFSYVPCKINDNPISDKVLIPFEYKGKKLMSSQRVGHPYNHFTSYNREELWSIITTLVLEQGFFLGIKFDEPASNNSLARNNAINSQNTKDKCSSKRCFKF